MKIKKRILYLLILLFTLPFLLFGCNTVEGMGEDIERGGEEIQEAAE